LGRDDFFAITGNAKTYQGWLPAKCLQNLEIVSVDIDLDKVDVAERSWDLKTHEG
jgi:hypothetical protein